MHVLKLKVDTDMKIIFQLITQGWIERTKWCFAKSMYQKEELCEPIRQMSSLSLLPRCGLICEPVVPAGPLPGCHVAIAPAREDTAGKPAYSMSYIHIRFLQ